MSFLAPHIATCSSVEVQVTDKKGRCLHCTEVLAVVFCLFLSSRLVWPYLFLVLSCHAIAVDENVVYAEKIDRGWNLIFHVHFHLLGTGSRNSHCRGGGPFICGPASGVSSLTSFCSRVRKTIQAHPFGSSPLKRLILLMLVPLLLNGLFFSFPPSCPPPPLVYKHDLPPMPAWNRNQTLQTSRYRCHNVLL
jgi:hypothetical protein